MTSRLRTIIGLMSVLVRLALMVAIGAIVIDERASRNISALDPTNEEMLEGKGR